ncbi:MAG: glycoside hydrolase family 26 protein [Firmicutes bacterium]|nr:glycoside hydrolase family 26 protein [Bacillota bacterium]
MKKIKPLCILFCGVLLAASLFACNGAFEPSAFGPPYNDNYVPDAGKVWFFAGQDLDAVGGLTDYSAGYADYFGIPAGVTLYSNLEAQGLTVAADFGAGVNHALRYTQNPDFRHCFIAVGLWFSAAQLSGIVSSQFDEGLTKLSEFFKGSPDNVFFLRIGYEFDGPHNAYPYAPYIAAYRYIVDKLRASGVDNFVSVWQSYGYETNPDPLVNKNRLLQWYPGDAYVDWLAYSYFDNPHISNNGQGILALAREKNKPVFIAESTPMGHNLAAADGQAVWDGFFTTLLNHIKQNIQTIRAVAYINQDWDNQPMWAGQGWGNSKLQANAYIRAQWEAEIVGANSVFIHKRVR